MNDKMKAAITGGAIAGILSAIPFVNFVNICCCAWAILGGLLAAHLYVKGAQTPATPADGATLGAIAGAVTAAIYLVIGVPLGFVVGSTMLSFLTDLVSRSDPAQAEALRRQMEASQNIGSAIMNGLIGAVLLFIFSTLGGLLGVQLFEKRKGGGGGGGGGIPSTPPPPPSNFGGGTQPPAGGGYGGGGGSYGAGS
jgi:hypothetical protein